jgi:hypothetical protein
MELDKGTSEKHFISILYNWLAHGEDNKIAQERIARMALDLHKTYWQRCEMDMKEKKANNS